MVLRGARSASFGIAFSKNDGGIFPLGESGDNLETRINCAQLVRHSHADMAIEHFRPALGVNTNECERRARSPSRKIIFVCTMFQKSPQKLGGVFVARPGDIGTSYSRRRQSAHDRIG